MSAAPKAVFLSYASQDADAARRICEALRAAGVEVWFDQSELRGGDAWDAKIRKQIAECALFLPLISANTQARREGYFRLEWRLAAQRTHMMSEQVAFLVPIVLDATRDREADVPPEFRAVQWTRVADDNAVGGVCEQIGRLLDGPREQLAAGGREPKSTPPAVTRRVTKRRSGKLAFIGLGVAAAAFFVVWKARPPAMAPAANAPASPLPRPQEGATSIAVLAFANMSADKDAEHFSDGVSEEVLNVLAKIPGLRVTARTSAFHFKGKDTPIPEIAKQLGVAYIVEGSVRKAGSRVRVAAKLVRAADSSPVWSDNFDRELKDIFAVQDEIAGLVANNLSATLGTARPAANRRAPTSNLAAYDAYLRGRALQTGAASIGDRMRGLRHFDEAVRLDPQFALAWARMAQLIERNYSAGADRSKESEVKARRAAAEALRLDAALPETHLAMAAVHHGFDNALDAAERELARAEQIRPHDADVAMLRARVEFSRGNWGAPILRQVERAAELDPRNTDSLMALGRLLSRTGHYARAEALLEAAWSLSQEGDTAPRFLSENLEAWTGNLDESLAWLQRVPSAFRNNELYFLYRGDRHLARGEILPAMADFERAVAMTTTHQGGRYWQLAARRRIAEIEAARGNRARADALYEETLALARELETESADYSDSSVALILATRGDAAAARAELARLHSRHPQNSPGSFVRRQATAEVLMRLGDHDEAIAHLRAMHEAGFGLGYTLRTRPQWAALRDHPKFQALMKEAEARADAQPRLNK